MCRMDVLRFLCSTKMGGGAGLLWVMCIGGVVYCDGLSVFNLASLLEV